MRSSSHFPTSIVKIMKPVHFLSPQLRCFIVCKLAAIVRYISESSGLRREIKTKSQLTTKNTENTRFATSNKTVKQVTKSVSVFFSPF